MTIPSRKIVYRSLNTLVYVKVLVPCLAVG